MSTGLDLRRRPGLWSYFSFGSTPHRRSVSSPERHELDKQEREDTLTKSSWGGRGRADTLEGYRTQPPTSMTGNQRSRCLKTGGIIALVLFLLYLLSSRGGDGVRDIVNGMSETDDWETLASLTAAQEAKQEAKLLHLVRTGK